MRLLNLSSDLVLRILRIRPSTDPSVTDEEVKSMVQQGAAWVYRRYADDPAYCTYEKAARDLKRGLWALPRDQRAAPWEWRKRKTLDGQFTDFGLESVAACVASLGR